MEVNSTWFLKYTLTTFLILRLLNGKLIDN